MTLFALKATFCVSILTLSTHSISAKPWRGIEPLRSTRADVVRLFNQCQEDREACEFSFENQIVYLLFSGGLESEHSECGKQLPPETVVFIEIEPRTTMKFGDLKLNKRMLKTFNPTAPYKFGYEGYLDETGGLVVKIHKGKVIQLDFIASAVDSGVCRSFYENPESFVKVYEGHVPNVSMTCPRGPVTEGDRVEFSAKSDFETKRGFLWALSTNLVPLDLAKRISGQNTKAISVDTAGIAGKTLSVHAEVRAGEGLTAAGTCKIEVLAKEISYE